MVQQYILLLTFLFCCLSGYAQQAILPVGQNMSNASGSASVSIGQIHYITTQQVISGVQQPFLEQYTLSVKAVENGEYINTEYYENEEVHLNAIATNPCSEFVQWSDGNTDNPRTITVTGNETYTALFGTIKYTIITESDNADHGSATISQ